MTSRLLVMMATAVCAVASLSVGREPDGPLLRATAGGALQLESSRDGQAVLMASGLRPGDVADGTLTLTNRAAGPQQLTLSTSGLVDTAGAGGGVLSQWLDLRVERDGEVVYAGKLADLPELDLGELAPGSVTPFRLAVAVPEQGPAVDDAYAGSGVEVAWSWRGEAEVGGAGSDSGSGSGSGGADRVPLDPSAEPEPPRPDPEPAIEPSGRPADPPLDELEGPAASGARSVRLWLGGRSRQRPSSALGLSAVCRPDCSVRATAKVRAGRRWRSLGRRSLGTVASGSRATALPFRLSAKQRRALRALVRRRGAVTVRISVTAAAPGHETVTKVRTLRLLP